MPTKSKIQTHQESENIIFKIMLVDPFTRLKRVDSPSNRALNHQLVVNGLTNIHNQGWGQFHFNFTVFSKSQFQLNFIF